MYINFVSNLIDKSKVSHLKRICKHSGIKGYSKWKKAELILNIKGFLASRIIQRAYRKYKMCNEVCYLTYQNVKFPCYPLKISNGQYYYYNLPDLVDYFLTSGMFQEPVSKRDLSIQELNSIDTFVKKLGIKRKNLCEAKKNTEFYRKQLVKEHSIDVLVDQIREIICIIRERLEADDIEDPTPNVDITFRVMYFPSLKSYWRELNKQSKRSLKVSFFTATNLLKKINIVNSESKKILRDNVVSSIETVKDKYFPV